MPTLVAKWTWEQDSAVDPPASVKWGDGRPATLDDYVGHTGDTHVLVESTDGLECRIFPDIVADVRYDAFARTWFVTGAGVETMSLDLSDLNATDHEITAALYELPTVYRAVIHR
jgi:hypothetical protein